MATVLVPIDGSSLAERALPLAVRLAHASGARLHLVRAVNPPVENGLTMPYPGVAELEEAANSELRAMVKHVANRYGVGATTAVSFGPAAAVVMNEIQRSEATVVVMTTHARAGFRRAVLGSVAELILRDSPVPVFLLPALALGREERPIRHIMLPTDGSALSQAVIEPVTRIAQSLSADLTLVRVYERGLEKAAHDLQSFAQLLRYRGLDVKDVTVVGHDPASQILRMAAVSGMDMIAMATHGRSGLDRLTHGSVTEQVLRHSEVPMLTFGQAALSQLLPAREPEAVRETRVLVTA